MKGTSVLGFSRQMLDGSAVLDWPISMKAMILWHFPQMLLMTLQFRVLGECVEGEARQ